MNDKHHVLSLGSRCFVARALELLKLRTYAGPFDWIYTSAAMVRHCLEDNFQTFLDAAELQKCGHAGAHQTYGTMLGRKVIFPHHRPLDRDRKHFERAVCRCQKVLESPEKKLLVFMHLVKSRKGLANVRDVSSKHGSNLKEVEALFNVLQKKVQNFHLLVVYVIEGATPEAVEQELVPITRPKRNPLHIKEMTGISQHQQMTIYEFRCQGSCTGLKFKVPEDLVGLQELVLSVGPFHPAPDPIQAERLFNKSFEHCKRKSLGRRPVDLEEGDKTSRRQGKDSQVTCRKNSISRGGQKRKAAVHVEDAKNDEDIVLVSVSTAVSAETLVETDRKSVV